MSDH